MSGVAIAPKEGEWVLAPGSGEEPVYLRQYYRFDKTTPSPQENQLPLRFRITQAADFLDRITLAASGAFSASQFDYAVEHLRELYGDDVELTIVDAREEDHWFCDGSSVAYLTAANNQNRGKNLDSINAQEREFAARQAVTAWVRQSDSDQDPKLSLFNEIETEEDLVAKYPSVSYARIPLTDHHGISLYALQSLTSLVESLTIKALDPLGPKQVIWLHCRGGKGRSSSYTLVAIMEIQRTLGSFGLGDDLPSFNDLAERVHASGGKDFTAEPPPSYKYNGAVCRKEILRFIHRIYSQSLDPHEDFELAHNFFTNEHRDIWENQIDLSLIDKA